MSSGKNWKGARFTHAASRALLAIAALWVLAPAPASAEELVEFSSLASPPATQAQVRGYLTRPTGAGPFPAVALLHSCLGLPGNRRSIADALASWSYIALFVDDFATRGLRETCAEEFGEGAPDAWGALLYLSKRPDVDPARIAVVGYSQGGDTALKIAAALSAVPSDGLRFKAAAAYYPPCENLAGAALEIPTVILVGALDEVTPAAACARLASRQPPARSDVKLVVYPGARHCFDDPRFAGGRQAFGMRLEYDAVAARRSSAALRAFLATQLGG